MSAILSPPRLREAQPPTGGRAKLSVGDMLRYGIGQSGAQIFRDTPAALLPVFMTTILGVPAWLAGVAILLPKLWVMICDPLIGAWSDRLAPRISEATAESVPVYLPRFDTAPMAVMEYAAPDSGYSSEATESVAEREFAAGEFAPGGGWEVLVAQKL